MPVTPHILLGVINVRQIRAAARPTGRLREFLDVQVSLWPKRD
jgi:hypothetical protein